MTQSKDDSTFTINLDDVLDTTGDITINLDYAMDSSWISVGDITASTIDIDSITTDTIDIGSWNLSGDFDGIYPSEVEKMCKEYPALEKVWRNFKSVYDMVKQDYEGKKKSGDIDD